MAITVNKKINEAGFTLIEMLVVVGIFAVVASVLLFHYSDFSTNIAVRDLAEEIGLSIRKAQSYATSVRSIAGTNNETSDQYPAYGITFSTNTTAQKTYDPTATSFTLFADVATNPNGADASTDNLFENDGTCGNPSVGRECVENLGITAGDRVLGLDTDRGVVTTANVVFHRPNPDAQICVVQGASCLIVSYLKVIVQSPKGATHTITIWNTGQISVN